MPIRRNCHFDSHHGNSRARLDEVLAEIRSQAQDFFGWEFTVDVQSAGPNGEGTNYSIRFCKREGYPSPVKMSSPAEEYRQSQQSGEQASE